MKHACPTALALAASVAMAFPAAAQSNEELLKELRALKDRVNELEKKLQGAPAPGQWGMTPEQARELNRVAVKAEALQDSLVDQGFKGLKITGQIDPTYIYNRNQDSASFVFLNNGGARYTYDNSYFGMAVLDFEKETESGTKWKLTIAPERGTGSLTNGGSIVHEASVSIPVGDLQTRLWLGQIPDWTGYELTLPAGNKLITHNLLFDTMAPTNYTGAVLDVTSGKWWTRVGVANVNSARNAPGNKAPSLIYRVDYSKGEFDGFGFSGVHGKTANFADDSGRNSAVNMFEVDAYYIRGDWSLYAQGSVGKQKRAAIFNSDGELRDAQWWGLSGTAAYMFTPRLEGVLRADYVRNHKNGGGLYGYSFDDGINGIGRGFLADGSFSGDESVGANRYALSVGLSYRVDENSTFKLEFRQDVASQPVFEVLRGGSINNYRKSNQLFGASVVVSF